MSKTVNVEDQKEVECSISEVLSDINHIEQVCANLINHLKDPEELWLCNVDVQHLESRLDDVIRFKISGIHTFLKSRGYLVEPPWEQKDDGAVS